MRKMYKLIRKLFSPPLLAEVEDFIESNLVLEAIFVFQEKGQPKGSREEFWIALKNNKENVGWHKQSEDNGKSKEILLPDNSFDELLKRLQDYDFFRFKDDLGKLKDGIHYTMVFVSRDRKRSVAIWNPSSHTKSDALVTQIKAFFDNLQYK